MTYLENMRFSAHWLGPRTVEDITKDLRRMVDDLRGHAAAHGSLREEHLRRASEHHEFAEAADQQVIRAHAIADRIEGLLA
jgi:hypothetical protein